MNTSHRKDSPQLQFLLTGIRARWMKIGALRSSSGPSERLEIRYDRGFVRGRASIPFGFLRVLSLLLALGSCLPSQGGVPLTDLILYGKVYQKTTQQQIVGTLPGKITVKINTATGPGDLEVTSTEELLSTGNGPAAYYVLRLKRFEAGTPRSAFDTFVMPGDTLHVYLDSVEVQETESVSLLVTDAPSEIRFLGLNAPSVADSDTDGLPDDWEIQFFGNLANAGDEDGNHDGVTNFMALALGLDPRLNNASKMPIVRRESNGDLIYYFRQSSEAVGLTYTVETSDRLTGLPWTPLTGTTPQLIGQEGTSVLYKVVVPGGVDRPERYFRLTVEQ